MSPKRTFFKSNKDSYPAREVYLFILIIRGNINIQINVKKVTYKHKINIDNHYQIET